MNGLLRLPRHPNPRAARMAGHRPGHLMLRAGSERRREQVPRAKHKPARGVHVDDVRFLDEVSTDVEPADVPAGREVSLWRESVIPIPASGTHKAFPHRLRRNRDVARVRSVHDAPRATVCTSFTPSSFSMRRDSCASESISTVAETTAVVASYTC